VEAVRIGGSNQPSEQMGHQSRQMEAVKISGSSQNRLKQSIYVLAVVLDGNGQA
jgi:hypothetical protein